MKRNKTLVSRAFLTVTPDSPLPFSAISTILHFTDTESVIKIQERLQRSKLINKTILVKRHEKD